MATTSSVGDVPVEFQLPRQGGARRGGHDDGGDDLVVLPPGGATPHAAREASQLRRSFFKSDLGATTAMSKCEHSLKLSKKEVIAIGRPRAPARENPAGIDAGERVGTTARRRSGASPRPDAYRVAARPAPPPLPSARRGLPSAHRAPRTPRQGRDERDRKPRHSVRRAASGQHRNRNHPPTPNPHHMTLTLTKPGQAFCGLRRGFAAARGRGGGAHTMYFADFRCSW